MFSLKSNLKPSGIPGLTLTNNFLLLNLLSLTSNTDIVPGFPESAI